VTGRMTLKEAGHPGRPAHVKRGVKRLVVPVAHEEPVEILTLDWPSR